MPPKKKDLNSEKPVVELQADHELFLQAFEKPTQIYRYLRTRNLISPIFLQRTLYYMRGRMDRNDKNRANFKLDSILDKLQQKMDSNTKLPGTFLNLIFTGFYDKKTLLLAKCRIGRITILHHLIVDGSSGDIARIETIIVKICHKKRKESSAPLTQFSFGSHDVMLNPGENMGNSGSVNKPQMLSIPTYHFTASNGHQVKSYLLVFRITLVHDEENGGEPHTKRRRISRNSSQESSNSDNSNTANSQSCNIGEEKSPPPMNGAPIVCYGTELIVYDRHGRCQLTPGQYELVALQLGPEAPPPGKASPKKNVIWESLDSLKLDGPLQKLQNSPVLKFSLSWTEDKSSTLEKPKLRPLQPLDIALANNHATKPKQEGVSSPEAPQLVLYQFIYNNNSRQQTEARYDFHCPWCSLKCLALYSLLKHLKLCHARFSFTYVPHPKGARIDVSLNECYDGSYTGNPQDLVVTPNGCSFSRSGPTRRSPTTSVLVCKPKRSKPSLSEFLEQDDNDYELPRSYILGHNRLYHHTMTCLPVQPHELDEDSEGEHDSMWVRTKTKMMIDDFTDVNDGEKELIKLWNLHIMKYNFVGDCQLSLACYMFIDNYTKELVEKNLYRNFLLHMASLHEFGLVGSGTMYKCIMMLQSLMENDGEVRKMFLSRWETMEKAAEHPFVNAFLSPKLKLLGRPHNCDPNKKSGGNHGESSKKGALNGESSAKHPVDGPLPRRNSTGDLPRSVSNFYGNSSITKSSSSSKLMDNLKTQNTSTNDQPKLKVLQSK